MGKGELHTTNRTIRPSIRWARARKHVAIEETCTRRIIQDPEANSFYDLRLQAGVFSSVHTGVEETTDHGTHIHIVYQNAPEITTP